MRRLSIYSETIDETFNRLEDLGECVVTCDYAISCLVDLGVRKMSTYQSRNDTYIQEDTKSRIYRFCMWE